MSLRYGLIGLLGLLITLLLLRPASAQTPLLSDSTISTTLKTSLQFRASVLDDEGTNTEQIGFGIRRARLQYRISVRDRFEIFMQVEGQGPKLLDANLTYRLSPRFSFTGGRLQGPQPEAFTPTPFFRIDAIERPFIARNWAAQTVGGDGRDFGLQAAYTASNFQARLSLSNGDGSYRRIGGNLRRDLNLESFTGGTDEDGLAVSGDVGWQPRAVSGLDLGGHLSYNGSRNPNTAIGGSGPGREYVSASTYLYWGRMPGSQPVRLKADALLIDYAENSTANGTAPEQTTGGLSLLAAVQPATATEVFARAERLERDLGEDAGATFLTAGASLSLSALRGGPYHAARITGAFKRRLGSAQFEGGDGPNATGAILQAQFRF
jgi:hypothetical protein